LFGISKELGELIIYYDFFINDIELKDEVWTAEDIMSFLLENNIWAFSSNAPNL